MKKLFICLATVAFVFTSCTKDHTCTCVSSTDGVDDIVYTYENVSKSDAEDACSAANILPGFDCTLD